MELSKKEKEQIFWEVYNGADVYYALKNSVGKDLTWEAESEIEEAVKDWVNKGDK